MDHHPMVFTEYHLLCNPIFCFSKQISMTNDLVLSSFRISTPAHIERNKEALLPISSNAITTFSDMGFGSFFSCSSNDFPMKNLPAALLEAGKELCSHVVLPTTTDGLLNENVVTSNVDHTAVVAKNSGCKRRKIKNELLPPKRSQKLGSRITLLQQLVSPFGKTDTASVLSETSLYIKDLHDKIEVLTMPFFTPNYLLWKDSKGYCLRSRGLCVVPIKFVIDTMGDILLPDQRTTFGSTFY